MKSNTAGRWTSSSSGSGPRASVTYARLISLSSPTSHRYMTSIWKRPSLCTPRVPWRCWWTSQLLCSSCSTNLCGMIWQFACFWTLLGAMYLSPCLLFYTQSTTLFKRTGNTFLTNCRGTIMSTTSIWTCWRKRQTSWDQSWLMQWPHKCSALFLGWRISSSRSFSRWIPASDSGGRPPFSVCPCLGYSLPSLLFCLSTALDEWGMLTRRVHLHYPQMKWRR